MQRYQTVRALSTGCWRRFARGVLGWIQLHVVRGGKRYCSAHGLTVLLVMSLCPSLCEAAPTTNRLLPATWGYLDLTKLPVLVALVLFGAFYFYLDRRMRAGAQIHLRRLPGIDAIEEAIGRATEMGRPVLFIPGINDIDDIQTLAGINILSHVAYIAAEYDTPVIVACRRSVVLTISEEVVKASSLAAGRPENYIPNNMRYLSDDQFAFTAGVNGIMLRERPASCIYQGCFYSESLILAETGYVSGAIQVAHCEHRSVAILCRGVRLHLDWRGVLCCVRLLVARAHDRCKYTRLRSPENGHPAGDPSGSGRGNGCSDGWRGDMARSLQREIRRNP